MHNNRFDSQETLNATKSKEHLEQNRILEKAQILKLEQGLYDNENKMNKEVFDALWELTVLRSKIGSANADEEKNITKALKLLEKDIPKIKCIRFLYDMNKKHEFYPKIVFDQIIDGFRDHISNWIIHANPYDYMYKFL